MQHLEVRIHRLLSVHQETKCLQSPKMSPSVEKSLDHKCVTSE